MTGQKKRGFATLDPEKLREISRKGGQTAHLLGVGHEFTHEEAVEAGRKGGRALKKKAQEKLSQKQISLPFETEEKKTT